MKQKIKYIYLETKISELGLYPRVARDFGKYGVETIGDYFEKDMFLILRVPWAVREMQNLIYHGDVCVIRQLSFEMEV